MDKKKMFIGLGAIILIVVVVIIIFCSGGSSEIDEQKQKENDLTLPEYIDVDRTQLRDANRERLDNINKMNKDK